MKIIELQAENVKRLKAVQIRPTGNLVELTGRNRQGKTSVLDAIWWALAGASHIQAAPIREGEDQARIRLDLGELKVTRTFKKREDETVATSIIVENEGGARFQSPQKIIDGLIGALSFDPLAFARSEPKQQFETLKRFVPGVDFDAIEKANREDYQARTEVNRRAKDLRAVVDGIIVPADTPSEPIEESALVNELLAAGEQNADLERQKARRQEAEREIQALEAKRDEALARAQDLRRQADEMERLHDCHASAAFDLRKKLEKAVPLPPPVDTSEVRERIEEARRVNELVAKRKRREDLLRQVVELDRKSADLTAAMEKRQAEKLEAIAAAKMPVEGISFGDGVVLLNGVPFDQASDAEQLRASIAIAMATNPKLRVIRVRDGSLLDDQAMSLLAEMAEAEDYQVWIERVDASGSVGFVLEDGEVRVAKGRSK